MHVLIADDHEFVRDALKLVLTQLDSKIEFLECSSFSNALELAAQCENLDLAVLDLRMPGMTVIAGVTDFCGRFPQTPTVILSGYYQRKDVVEALHHGAAGFISKDLNSKAMLNAFRFVLAGGKFIPADLLPDRIAASGDTENLDSEQENGYWRDLFSAREREVLDKLGLGLTNKEIGRELGLVEVTIKLHLRNIYRKLGAKNRAHAVRIAQDRGWNFGSPETRLSQFADC